MKANAPIIKGFLPGLAVRGSNLLILVDMLLTDSGYAVVAVPASGI